MAIKNAVARLSGNDSTSRREAARALQQMLLSLDEATRVFGEAQRHLSSLRDSKRDLLTLVEQLLDEAISVPTNPPTTGSSLPLTLGNASERTPTPLRLAEAAVQPRLSVRLLGRLEVEIDGRPLPVWRSRRARQLFEFLLLNRREEINRHRLMGIFWPDHSEDRAENNLSLTVMALRRHLELGQAGDVHALIGFKAGCYFIDTSRLQLDVDDFEAAVTEARLAETERDPGAASRSYDEAISLYRGDLLPSELYEDWTVGRRQGLQDLFSDALQRRSGLARQANDYDLSIRLSHRLLELDPASESAHRRLILDYLNTGQRSRAVQQADACRAALLRHLGAEPDTETRAVFKLLSST